MATISEETTELELLSKKPKALKSASAMGQPVTSSSGGSVYHLVAMSQGVRVAARVKTNGTLSVRVEGITGTMKDFPAKIIEDMGLSFKDNYDYASGHFSTPTPESALKTLGAVLAMLPDKVQVMHNAAKLVGAGT